MLPHQQDADPPSLRHWRVQPLMSRTQRTPGRGTRTGSRRVAEAADAAGVELDIKGGRHYTASQLLAGGFDVRNTAARLGHSGGGAITLRHHADPVPQAPTARRRLPRAANRRIRNSDRLKLAVRRCLRSCM